MQIQKIETWISAPCVTADRFKERKRNFTPSTWCGFRNVPSTWQDKYITFPWYVRIWIGLRYWYYRINNYKCIVPRWIIKGKCTLPSGIDREFDSGQSTIFLWSFRGLTAQKASFRHSLGSVFETERFWVRGFRFHACSRLIQTLSNVLIMNEKKLSIFCQFKLSSTFDTYSSSVMDFNTLIWRH